MAVFLAYLLEYRKISGIWIISHILFFPKSYNPKHMTLCTIKKQSRYTFFKIKWQARGSKTNYIYRQNTLETCFQPSYKISAPRRCCFCDSWNLHTEPSPRQLLLAGDFHETNTSCNSIKNSNVQKKSTEYLISTNVYT